MKYYKFLLTMIVVSMLSISFTAVTGTQIPNFSAEKLKINKSIKFTNPSIINKFEEVFKSIISHFMKIIPAFIMMMFFSQNNKDFEIVNAINEISITNNLEKATDTNEDIIDIENSGEEMIVINEGNNIIYEDNNDIVDDEDTEEEVSDEGETQQNEYDLELTFELYDEYKFGRPIPVTAILTNIGEKTLFLCEMGAKLMTLDLVIETPLGFTIHYIGPFEGEAKIVKLDSSQSIISEINLTSPNVTFGDKTPFSSAVHSPYVFIIGDYTLRGIYTSDYIEVWEASNFWHGSLISPMYEFSIK